MKAPPRLHPRGGLRAWAPTSAPYLHPAPTTTAVPVHSERVQSQTEYCRSNLLGFEAPGTAPGRSRETTTARCRLAGDLPWVSMGSGTQHETSLYLYTITAIHKSKRPCTPSLLGSIRRLKRLEEDGPAVTADPSQMVDGWSTARKRPRRPCSHELCIIVTSLC